MDVNVMREQTCCFTGHRELPPQELDQIVEGLKTTIAALITKGIRYFGAGGALGFDALARPAHKGVDFPALGRRQPLNPVHTSSAA